MHSFMWYFPHMKITLRKAEKNDLEAIQALQSLLDKGRESQYDISNKAFHSKTKTPDSVKESDLNTDHFIVAEIEDTIIGYVWGSIDKRPHHKLKKMGYIDELFIVQEYRKKGIAKQLLNELEAFFVNKGCDFIFTNTDWENKNAQSLYSSFGMNKVTAEYWKKL